MQMDAGRRRGASRKTMLAANLITVTLLSLCVGLVLAALLLPFSGLPLSTGGEPPASTSLTFSFGMPCHRRCSVIYGATSTRWNDFSGGQPGYTTSWWSAHMDRDRRGLSDGGSGRGVAGGSPASVVSEHRARLFHLFGAVVDVPGAARRGGQVAGSRCAGSARFLGMAA